VKIRQQTRTVTRSIPQKKNKPQGEYLYGIQPVLAALTAKRRNFFQLYLISPTDTDKSKHVTRIERYVDEFWRDEVFFVMMNNAQRDVEEN
jgi:hypothetical protein